MNDQVTPAFDSPAIRRICSEYLEMPGLRLTSKQAQRLFGLGEQACVTLLDALVERKFLARRPDGTYGRLTDGHSDIASMLAGARRRLHRTA